MIITSNKNNLTIDTSISTIQYNGTTKHFAISDLDLTSAVFGEIFNDTIVYFLADNEMVKKTDDEHIIHFGLFFNNILYLFSEMLSVVSTDGGIEILEQLEDLPFNEYLKENIQHVLDKYEFNKILF